MNVFKQAWQTSWKFMAAFTAGTLVAIPEYFLDAESLAFLFCALALVFSLDLAQALWERRRAFDQARFGRPKSRSVLSDRNT